MPGGTVLVRSITQVDSEREGIAHTNVVVRTAAGATALKMPHDQAQDARARIVALLTQ